MLGQSFGGFCTVTYLSFAPHGVREAFITGGLPGLDVTADDVYRAAYPRVAAKNADPTSTIPRTPNGPARSPGTSAPGTSGWRAARR